MDSEQILRTIEIKINQLKRARELLMVDQPAQPRSRKQHIITKSTHKPTRVISPEGRASIAAAQRARWAKQKQQRKA
jgi:Ni,Fe-hydrogenase III large subunit